MDTVAFKEMIVLIIPILLHTDLYCWDVWKEHIRERILWHSDLDLSLSVLAGVRIMKLWYVTSLHFCRGSLLKIVWFPYVKSWQVLPKIVLYKNVLELNFPLLGLHYGVKVVVGEAGHCLKCRAEQKSCDWLPGHTTPLTDESHVGVDSHLALGTSEAWN